VADRHPPACPPDESASSLARELQERVKKLNCLFGISDIFERSGGSLEKILEEIVELLPPSWEHSEVACSRVLLGDQEFRSGNYGAAGWSLREKIRVHGREAGTIEVSYLEARPPRDEGPFTNEEGRLLKAVAERLGHVIERMTAEERLRKKEDELRERMTHITRVSTMGEMASSIAHEVNQPLTAVATYAQACRRLLEAGETETSEVLEVLDRIGEEALRAGNIIHRLRDLVRKRKHDVAECDLVALLKELLPLVSVDARLHEVQLRFVLPPHLHPVLADGIQIQQVILNLIRNGIDSMRDSPVGGRVLEVGVGEADGRHAELRVTDHGCGLPEGNEEDLFEPFFTTKEGGLGMGLSISRSIIAQHRGRLRFSKNSDGGTTFSFTLPFASEGRDA